MRVSDHNEIDFEKPKRKCEVGVWRVVVGVVVFAIVALILSLFFVPRPHAIGMGEIAALVVVGSVGIMALAMIAPEIVALVRPVRAAKARRCAALVLLFVAAMLLLSVCISSVMKSSFAEWRMMLLAFAALAGGVFCVFCAVLYIMAVRAQRKKRIAPTSCSNLELKRVKSSYLLGGVMFAIALSVVLICSDFDKPIDVVYVLAFFAFLSWLLADVFKENKRDRVRPHYHVRITSPGLRPHATVCVDYGFEGDSAPAALAVYVLQRDATLGRLPKKQGEDNTPERGDRVFDAKSPEELLTGHFTFTIPDAIESERIKWELALVYSSSPDANENNADGFILPL